MLKADVELLRFERWNVSAPRRRAVMVAASGGLIVQRRRSENGVTGIFAVESQRVCQVLDGGQEIVAHFSPIIRRDDRHCGIV